MMAPKKTVPQRATDKGKNKGQSERKNEITIAVMGATGSGKSSFINMASQSHLRVSNRLGSCTQEVETGDSFELDGRTVVLIDTPGFDDTDKSDAEVLKIIAASLEALYRNGVRLHGVLYFHRITDNRMGGISKRSFDVFQKLCGDKALKNVIIVTNMWGNITAAEGEAREQELKTDPKFFKSALEKNAKMTRHNNTVPSAHRIIRAVFNNDPLPLAIQYELVDLVKPFHSTEAGQEITRGLDDLIRKHAKDIEQLQVEIKGATRGKDKKAIQELKGEQRRVSATLTKVRKEAKNLAADYRKQRLRAMKGHGPNEAGSCC